MNEKGTKNQDFFLIKRTKDDRSEKIISFLQVRKKPASKMIKFRMEQKSEPLLHFSLYKFHSHVVFS